MEFFFKAPVLMINWNIHEILNYRIIKDNKIKQAMQNGENNESAQA
jgi:hypothetical protein